MDLVLAIAFGLALGGVAVWAYLRRQRSEAFEHGRASMDAERAALFERIAARDRDVERLQRERDEAGAQRQAEAATLRAESERRSAAEQRASRIPQLEAALDDRTRAVELRDRSIAELRSEIAGLAEKLLAERAMSGEKLALVNEAQAQLTSAFRALSGQALAANNQMFLDLAEQKLGQSGQAFLFNDAERIVGHPGMNRLMAEIPERQDDLPPEAAQ